MNGFASNQEYLNEALIWLNLRLKEQYDQRSTRNRELSNLAGLIISEEDVEALLQGEAGGTTIDTKASGLQADRLEEKLDAIDSHVTGLALPYLKKLFHLSGFEERCLIIALAVELDAKYEKIFGYLQDDITRKFPTVEFVCDLICDRGEATMAQRQFFHHDSALFKYRLLNWLPTDGPTPLRARAFKIDERIARFIVDNNSDGGSVPLFDADLSRHARLLDGPAKPETTDNVRELPDELCTLITRHIEGLALQELSEPDLFIHLYGEEGAGRFELVQDVVLNKVRKKLLVADCRRMLGESEGAREAIWTLARESLLQPAIVCLRYFDALTDHEKASEMLPDWLEALRRFARVTIFLGTKSWKPDGLRWRERFIPIKMPPNTMQACRGLWADISAQYRWQLKTGQLDELAAVYRRLTPGQIRAAAGLAENLHLWRKGGVQPIDFATIHEACRRQASPFLSRLAQRMPTAFAWDDLVLPKSQLQELRELTSHIRNESKVMESWGFADKLPRGRGLTALFAGPSGTGKTMASQIIARELGMECYKVDLSACISKYIGETEKNLDRIFSEAEAASACLLFDECDALFGKRSEVKDAHDRYANIEVSYLLQRMEEFNGIAILATNLRKNMDAAFVRRLRFIVDFPHPDARHREQIWRKSIPARTPLADDVQFKVLARFKFSGGHIKHIVLRAAFVAAEAGTSLNMEQLMQACRQEYVKLGRLVKKETFAYTAETECVS